MDNNLEIEPHSRERSRQVAERAMEVAEGLQASDICLLDISKVSDFANYFVVLTAESSRQMESLIEDIEQEIEGMGMRRHHIEGSHKSGWVLLDFGDAIIHMFGVEEREFYGLEQAWVEMDAVEVYRYIDETTEVAIIP